jgi:erythromycin esterase-like protein
MDLHGSSKMQFPEDGVLQGQNEVALDAMAPYISNAHIVGLGEATHGSHLQFAMKVRLIQYLTEGQGYRVFVIEAPKPSADKVDDYIQTGEGSPRNLVTNLQYWPWKTQEIVDLVEWMRFYKLNHTANDKIHSRGKLQRRQSRIVHQPTKSWTPPILQPINQPGGSLRSLKGQIWSKQIRHTRWA